MNKARRKVLDQLSAELADIEARLEAVRDEEWDAFDAMPPAFAESERGERAGIAAEALDDACGHVADLLISIDEAVNQ